MSRENVEIVRSIYEPWERGDFRSIEWANPDIEYVFADGPTPGSWTGVSAMSKAWLEFLGSWAEYRVEANEYRELDEERVLVLDHRIGRGKTSGVDLQETAASGAVLFHIRDGKVTRLVLWGNLENAFADLGLTPETRARE
jgi:ketosteroid isomerase-like protein